MFKLFMCIFIFHYSSQSGFQKDLNVNIPFPPILNIRDGIPTGHLRPLGWQSRAEAPVAEEPVVIEPETFWNKYIEKSRPVVLRGLVLGSEASEQWTDSYLDKKYGHLDIKLAERKQNFKSYKEKTQFKLSNFLKGYRIEDWYLNGIMPEEMQREAPISRMLNCGPFTTFCSLKDKNYEIIIEKLVKNFNKTWNMDIPKIAQLVEPYLWLSAGETSSLIHSHPEHNLHCVLDGRKDFILIPSEQFSSQKNPSKHDKKKASWRKELDLFESYNGSNEWYSKIDVDKINAYKYKILNSMKWYYSSIRSGDCIYTPANYLHQVRSHGRSLSSSIYFKTFKLPSKLEEIFGEIKSHLFNSCSKNAPLFESMASVQSHFLWTYTHSERHLKQKDFNENDAKYYLHYLVKNHSLLYENFENFYEEITGELKNRLSELKPLIRQALSLTARDIWNELADENILSLDQIYDLSDSKLEKLTKILGLAANFHDLDYFLVNDEL
ncbi:domain-containing 5 [Brachionus plicatilis]|uniref:Domain-containing 5 n=1 Tax=Brachionus plicatilis TaxID=10195 RepID=A0A3M7QFL6_BRAPC|nr:domain-containing 5 [Brachionus plicatilis]